MKNTNPVNQSEQYLVIGATGKTGRRVVERLQAQGLKTRGVSRSTAIPFNWENPGTWNAALEGITAIYITYSPDLAVPGAPETVEAFVKLAKERGIERIVLLSGRGEEEAQRAEQLVLTEQPRATVVRASWFAQNFDEGPFAEFVASGVVALPVHGATEPFIDIDDIADVVVAALTSEGHEGEIYEVTGPRLMTFNETIAEISKASGRDIQFLDISIDEFVSGMKAQQVPEDFIDLLVYLFTTILDGRNSYTADGVSRALGRPPRDFSEYASKVAATGAWNTSVPAGAES